MSVGDGALAAMLVSELGGGEVTESFGQSTAHVPLADWVRASRLARDMLGCAMFDHLSVHDRGGPAESGLEWDVVAHVVVPTSCAGLLMRTTLPTGAVLPSVTGTWAGAAWHEREAAEMAGIEVSGHPDLRPLLLAPGTGLHPLRKDTLLVSRAVRPWPGRMEPGESAVAPSAGRRRATAPGLPPEGWGDQ
ncbi:MAG: NADH-quinone oxidoreductase subunit C [Mycobacteriaceae bacterium]